ncbi:MAG: hypothetical protein HY875_12230 [Chloroflexi bacterium]|nr:hypothetical protein [Chloroflexota bacterium]
MSVTVIVPEGMAVAGATVYRTLADVLAALRGDGPAVLCSDGFDDGWLEPVAAEVRVRAGPVIEVRSQRWDGVTPSPVSAACRGVISGFGVRGVDAAVSVLAD